MKDVEIVRSTCILGILVLIMNFAFAGVGIYVLYLIIKALRIYIKNFS